VEGVTDYVNSQWSYTVSVPEAPLQHNTPTILPQCARIEMMRQLARLDEWNFITRIEDLQIHIVEESPLLQSGTLHFIGNEVELEKWRKSDWRVCTSKNLASKINKLKYLFPTDLV